jgi:flagellar hook assembly protein FlgD
MQAPDEFHLDQNYPNPFNPSTTISYVLSQNSHVVLTIYNTKGEMVYNLVNEFQVAGKYKLHWNGLNSAGAKVASGIYFYKITASKYSTFKKMLFLR